MTCLQSECAGYLATIATLKAELAEVKAKASEHRDGRLAALERIAALEAERSEHAQLMIQAATKPRCTCNAYTTKFWAATRCNGQLLGAQDLDDLEKGWKRLTGDPLDRAGAYEVLVFKYRQETFTKETGVDAA